jgi:hypothetical protein
MTVSEARVVSATERDAILNEATAAFARREWTITSVFAGQAIAQRRIPVGGTTPWISVVFWVASILLTLVTGGLWLIVLVIQYLSRATETTVITVDSYGKLHFS